MKKIFITLGILLFSLCLYGFEADAESKRILGTKEEKEEPAVPILHYEEETVSPQKTNAELYQQYHLLIVSSLEEAQNYLADDQRWAYRMVHNASKYMQLLLGLLHSKDKDNLLQINQDIKQIVLDIKVNNLSEHKKKKIERNIGSIVRSFEKQASFSTAKAWIKK